MNDIDDWSSQLRRGVLELSILALIERGPTYGYEIVSQLASAPQLAASEGTIYPLLRRLRRDGRLETSWHESAAGPPRQYYRLTSEGRARLKAMRQEWRAMVGAVARCLDDQGGMA